MECRSKYGIHRVVEPKGVLPQPAWKLDNDMHIHEDEILIDVKTININSSSFRQICTECENDIEKIKEMILKIVDLRGKLHNPITNTGGILFGKVKKIGSMYKNIYDIEENDDVIPLVSLSLIPLKIYTIKNIDMNSAQIQVDGEAILFSSNPIIKIGKEIKAEHITSILDEAGSCIQAYSAAKEGDRVLIMGAFGKIGLFCATSVRDKIRNTGKMVGIVYSKGSKNVLEKFSLYDEVYCCDVTNPIRAFETLKLKENELFDLVIDCTNTFGTETFSILMTKNKGTIYFANLSTDYNTACLTSEGIGRDINIIPYKGYAEGHAKFAIELYQKYEGLRQLILRWMEKDISYKIGKEKKVLYQMEESTIKGINLEQYVFASDEMKKLLAKAIKVASYECSVLITGESGTGKEIIAQVIYKSSRRNQGPFIKINCSSIPENLLESELFGYEKGAFTGASTEGKKGFFEIAEGGTLFLDEVGELPLSLQPKLLRAIQEKEIYRVGGTEPVKVNVRLVAATNRDLINMVKKGYFREDLYYRLNVFPINVPPLRKRRKDIIPLAKYFVEKYNKKFGTSKYIETSALQYMLGYPWQGNIREMENLIQRLLIVTENNKITVMDLIENIDKEDKGLVIKKQTLNEAVEKTEYEMLKMAKAQYKTTRKMASALGVSQSTLVRKLKKYGI